MARDNTIVVRFTPRHDNINHWEWFGEGEDREYVQLEAGDEIEMTRARYLTLRDRFTPAENVMVDDYDFTELESMNVGRAKLLVAKQDSVDALVELIDTERQGKNRSTVIEAAEDRLEQLG